jgi:superfamily II DNA or RNA helicase
MMAYLYPDQEAALASVDKAFDEGFQGVLLCAATGFGKTHSAVEYIHRQQTEGLKIWFLAHLAELLDDTSQRLIDRRIDFGWIRSNYQPNYKALCQLVSLKTAIRRLDLLPRPDIVIIDECDLAVAPSYREIIKAIGFPRLLGLTGTPIRLDNRPMRDGGFDYLIRTPDTIDLIDSGRLSNLKMWSFKPPPELLKVKDVAGDFDQGESGRIMSTSYVLDDALKHWQQLCVVNGVVRPTAVFCSSVKAAIDTAAEWNRAGFRAMAVHGGSSKADRTKAITGLRDGSLDAVMSADLWIAGVDVKRIACILCLRITKSLRIWLQMVGRGLRKNEEWSDCYLLDCVGNILREGIGNPLARRMHLWTLDGSKSAGSRNMTPMPHVPVCQVCFSCDVVNRVCRECNHVQEIRLPHGPKVIRGELLEIDPRKALKEEGKKNRAAEERACNDFNDFVALGRNRGYDNPEGWAHHKIRLRQAWRYQSPRSNRIAIS